uniref:ZAD domain-containing protein n=1 Tax=Timema genevievae TaxID=629358 RepID=A0A7R9JTJ2_TIMGE|nr:unnamed protein product [Timema genevievae]
MPMHPSSHPWIQGWKPHVVDTSSFGLGAEFDQKLAFTTARAARQEPSKEQERIILGTSTHQEPTVQGPSREQELTISESSGEQESTIPWPSRLQESTSQGLPESKSLQFQGLQGSKILPSQDLQESKSLQSKGRQERKREPPKNLDIEDETEQDLSMDLENEAVEYAGVLSEQTPKSYPEDACTVPTNQQYPYYRDCLADSYIVAGVTTTRRPLALLSASLKPILWDGGREGEKLGVASQPTKVSFLANKNRWITETIDGASYQTSLAEKSYVEEGDGFPSQICTKCSGHLDNWYAFKEQCHSSDATLRQHLQTDSKIGKLKEEAEDRAHWRFKFTDTRNGAVAPMFWARKQAISTELPSSVGENSAYICGYKVSCGQHNKPARAATYHSSSSLLCSCEAELTSFQTHCFTEKSGSTGDP